MQEFGRDMKAFTEDRLAYLNEANEYMVALAPTVSASTVEQTIWMLRAYLAFAWTRKKITPDTIDEFSNQQVEDGRPGYYVAKHRNVVKKFYDWLIRRGSWKERNPVMDYRVKPSASKRRTPITQEEFELLIEKCGKMWFVNLITICWHTGLRMGDAAMLRWESVDPRARVIRLTTRKNTKAVEIPFGDEVATALMSCSVAPSEERHVTDFVLIEASVHYRFDRNKTLSRMFGELVRKAGLKDRCFHCLRHSFVSRHLAAGANPAILATITGHGLGSIMAYVTASVETKRKAMGLTTN